MRIFDADQWEEIADTLSRNKTRTFLTAFGIFWGVFMLILLMGGGRGLVNILVPSTLPVIFPNSIISQIYKLSDKVKFCFATIGVPNVFESTQEE